MTTRNKELAEQREKKERTCNKIMHGREENKEQSDDALQALFVTNLIQQVCSNVTPKLISRTGRSEDNKKKPVKVNTVYKGISITKDYTVSGRQMTKEDASKAKEKN